MFSIADNLKSVRQRIQKATNSAGREENSVDLLAVSKTRKASELKEALDQGLRCFGENYLNEALEKQSELKTLLTPAQYDEIEWHFIGPIQSNKTRPIAENFQWVQSVDRPKILQRLNDQRPDELPPLNVCIQININDEESKSGIPISQLETLVSYISNLPKIKLRGLMTIPKATQDEKHLSASFQTMRQALDSLHNDYPLADTLSMGMSGDIETAIENGSTMVRVGTALFGPRAPK